MVYAFLRWIMRTMTRVYLIGLFRIIDEENVPRTGPALICPNHSANLDPPLVPAFLPRGDSWNMAKSEYFSGFFSWLFRAYHAFPVVRHSADRTALRRAFDVLKSGQVLIMYPEGTRGETGALREPEAGAGFIAQKSEAPVVPVAMMGTRECLPKGARWPRRVPVTIRYGKPFVIAQKKADGTRVTRDEAAAAIMCAIAEMLPPEMRGVYSDFEARRARLAGVTEPVGAR